MIDIRQTIKARYHTMSGGHQKIADYILSHTDAFLYQSSAQVAAELGLSESTVVRFAFSLDYPKFKAFQRELKAQTASRLDLIGQFTEHDIQKDDLLYPFQQDLINIEETVRGLDLESVNRAVDLITGARRIGVVALRGAMAPAIILSQFLNELLDNTRLLTPGNGDSYDVLKSWDGRDLLICCEFVPFEGFVHTMLTYGRARGCHTVSIVGNLASCLIPVSDVVLEVKKDGTFISYSAAVVLVNILIHAVSRRNSTGAVSSLSEMQEILRLANGRPDQ